MLSDIKKVKEKPLRAIIDPFSFEAKEDCLVIVKQPNKVEFVRHHTFIQFNHILSYTDKHPYFTDTFSDITPKEAEIITNEIKTPEENQ